MECSVNDDFDINPLDRVYPDRVEISLRFQTLTLYYRNLIQISKDDQFLIYANNQIIDRFGSNGKSYNLSLSELTGLNSFAVVVIKQGLPDDYNPLCEVEVNMFNIIHRDAVLASERYVCAGTPSYDENNKPNFISSEWKQTGLSIRPGSIAHMKSHSIVMGEELVIKSSGRPKPVINVRDYRYFTDYDIQAFQTGKIRKVPCSPYRLTSYKTCRKVKLPDGVHLVSDISVDRI